MSMYIDHKSHRLGCESTMPSNIVLPRSGSPNLYSSWANFEIVFKSDRMSVRIHGGSFVTHVFVFQDSVGCEEVVF